MVVLEIVLSIFVRNINKACPFHPLKCLHFMRNDRCIHMKDQMLQESYTEYLSSSESWEYYFRPWLGGDGCNLH